MIGSPVVWTAARQAPKRPLGFEALPHSTVGCQAAIIAGQGDIGIAGLQETWKIAILKCDHLPPEQP